MSPSQTSSVRQPSTAVTEPRITEVRPQRNNRKRDALKEPERIDCWTPGHEATLDVPELAELFEIRDDHSIVVEQAPGTEALLRIPLLHPRMSPERVTTHILFFTLAAKLNKSVKIDLLSLRRDGDLFHCQPVDLIGKDYDVIFDALDANRPNRIYDVGVMLDMHLMFLPGAERGRIELRGVGGGFF